MGQYVRLLKMVQTRIPCGIQTGFTVFLRHLMSWTTTLGTRSSLAMFASTATRKRRLHHRRPFRGLVSIRGILPNSEAAQTAAPLSFHPSPFSYLAFSPWIRWTRMSKLFSKFLGFFSSRTLVGVDKVGNRYFARVEEIDGISKSTLNLFFSLASRIH